MVTSLGQYVATHLGFLVGLDLIYYVTDAHWQRTCINPSICVFPFGQPMGRVPVAISLKLRHGIRSVFYALQNAEDFFYEIRRKKSHLDRYDA